MRLRHDHIDGSLENAEWLRNLSGYWITNIAPQLIQQTKYTYISKLIVVLGLYLLFHEREQQNNLHFQYL